MKGNRLVKLYDLSLGTTNIMNLRKNTVFLQKSRQPKVMKSDYYIMDDEPFKGGRFVKSTNPENINQAIFDSYQAVRLPSNYFKKIRFFVSSGRNPSLLHNMQNLRVCRDDFARKITSYAGDSVQVLPISLYDEQSNRLDDYFVLNPLSRARVDLNATDAKWWDGKVGGEIQHWYSLAIKPDSISAPIFRINEVPTLMVVNNNIKSIFEEVDAEGVHFQRLPAKLQ
jgi:hypothetical protein